MPEYEERPRALQMAARVEKVDPALLDDIFIAAARGVIMLLDDHRCLPDGEWHDDVTAWTGARIRKIMRRARASNWERAQSVPGITVVHGTAQVRIFVPGVVDEAPRELSKLQIQSSPLEEPDRINSLQAVAVPTLTILLNPSVDMSWGKRCAQVGHAAQRCWEQLDRVDRFDWNAAGRQIRVHTPTQSLWDEQLVAMPTHIHDGGFTEIEAGTLTAAAVLERRAGPLANDSHSSE